MKKLVEYKYEKLVSLCIDEKNLRKIIKIPAENGYFQWNTVDIFPYIDTIELYIYGYYVGNFRTDKNINFLHFVKKIELLYHPDIKHYCARIHLTPPGYESR